MSSYRWLEVFALAWCFAWAAAQENSTQSSTTHSIVKSLKLVSTEFQLNAEGNPVTRCVILSFPVPGQVQTEPGQPAAANRIPPRSSPMCPPPKTPTSVYDPESVLGALIDASSDVSFIREEAKNYFVSYERDRSLSKTQVLEVILGAMMGSVKHETMAAVFNILKSQIEALREEAPRIVVLCVPGGFEGGRIVNDCTPIKTVTSGGGEGAMGSKMSYVEAGITSAATPFGEKSQKRDVRRGIKTAIDIPKGSNKAPKQGLGWLSYPVTGSEQSFSRSQVAFSGMSPAAMDSPTAQSPHSPVTKNAPAPSHSRQTGTATLQFSVSGWARVPLSISKVLAEVSLFFAPVAETNASTIFPSAAKSNIPTSPFFLKPTKPSFPLSPAISPNTMSTISAATPTVASLDTIFPQPPANFTPLVHSSQADTTTAVSAAATISAAPPSTYIPSVALKSISSQLPSGESTAPPYPSPDSPTTPPAAPATEPQFSTRPNMVSTTTE